MRIVILLINLFIVLVLFTARGSRHKISGFNREILLRHTDVNSGIIISCFNCTCITSFMSSYIANGGTEYILADTTCIKLKSKKMRMLPQKVLDSAYERNYNAILFKDLNNKDKFTCQLLTTEESSKFSDIVNNFFYK